MENKLSLNKIQALPDITGKTGNVKPEKPVESNNSTNKAFENDKFNLNNKIEKAPFSGKSGQLEIATAKPFNKDAGSPPVNNLDKKDLHFLFFSDSHSRSELMNKFIQDANNSNPDLIIDSGDIVHDATEPEITKAYNDRKDLKAPLYMTTGNHDVDYHGPFNNPPPEIPDFQSFDAKDVHFILLDDESQHISDEQFKKLEQDLESNKGKPVIVAMHVPVHLSKEPLTVKLTKKLPLNFKSPTLADKVEIDRFTALMTKYNVKAVITGHTHFADETEVGGVKYITVGATGGLTPGMGIDNEYLDIIFNGKDLDVKRVTLKEGTNNPVSFLANSMSFYQDLNASNHAALGWNFTPSASIQYSAGGKITESKNGTSYATTVNAGLERILSPKSSVFVNGGLNVGPKDLNTNIDVGYKYRVLGDFNKNVFVSGSVGANAGIVVGRPSAGVGAGVGVGAEYKNLTFGLGYQQNTNSKATSFTIGYRF